MATNLVMPALEMAQESGLLVRWINHEGESVTKGEPIIEIETDKVTVEIEAPASGILSGVSAKEGEVIPVGQTIAWILAPGEKLPAVTRSDTAPLTRTAAATHSEAAPQAAAPVKSTSREVSPLARNIAEEHGVDLTLVKSNGKRIEKADVLAYLSEKQPAVKNEPLPMVQTSGWRLAPASPKARRLAAERGIALAAITGSGPEGAVLTADVLSASPETTAVSEIEKTGTVWRVMTERMVNSWTTVPHFYLVREVDASSLVEWRKHSAPLVEKRAGFKLTYTDLLVKLLGAALRDHPRLNAAWADGDIRLNQAVNVGVAAAIEDGLIVPVIQNADKTSLTEIAHQRSDLIQRAADHKLRPADIAGGTFTLTNLGMYNVDAFYAIVNTPQAAILAVGRIAERVVPHNGQPAVRPMITLTLSCDHRMVDGARAAQFLDDLANLMEDPWRLLV